MAALQVPFPQPALQLQPGRNPTQPGTMRSHWLFAFSHEQVSSRAGFFTDVNSNLPVRGPLPALRTCLMFGASCQLLVVTAMSCIQHLHSPGHRRHITLERGRLTQGTSLMGKLRHEEVKANISKRTMLQASFSAIPRSCRCQ